jgi:protein-S-isoprenylcysteine O-methyltransferase Ste14
MKRAVILLYGLVSYVIFFATFLYAIGFIGDFWVPRSIDSTRELPLWNAVAINLGLLAAFALQHSVMARPAFKRWWTRMVPEAAERSTYVLFSSLALIALFYFWSPIGGVVWDMRDPLGSKLIYAAFASGWLIVLLSTFLINHFDLFGLRQVWLYFRRKPYTSLPFKTPVFYRVVRHPLYVGWFLVVWSTPTMTSAHLLFAVMTSAYILIGIQLEEHDLTQMHPEYAQYRRQVPMLVPFTKRRAAGIVNARR